MNFTELAVPPKYRMIIRVHATKVLEPTGCEICHMSRFSFADARPAAPMCDVCGRMLCWECYGKDGHISGPDLNQYNCCDSCAELEAEEIEAILHLRMKLNRT
jgi:hypothetical protein